MNGLLTRRFWADTLERAIRAAAWAVVGGQGASATPGIDVSVPLRAQLLAAGYAAMACVLFSVGIGGQVGASDSASVLPANLDPPKEDGHADLATLCIAVVGALLAYLIVVAIR